jgi:hypothetical protein
MIDPKELIKEGIQVYKANQRPREYVCTFFKVKVFLCRPIMLDFRMGSMSDKLLIFYHPGVSSISMKGKSSTTIYKSRGITNQRPSCCQSNG